VYGDDREQLGVVEARKNKNTKPHPSEHGPAPEQVALKLS